MSNEKLEITKEKVLKASETCPDAKEVLKELFPEAFEKEEDKNITIECNFRVTRSSEEWLRKGHMKLIDFLRRLG